MSTNKPVYLLAGGPGSRRNSPDPLLQMILRETGKPSPTVAYVGAASGDDKNFFRMIANFFTLAGAGKVEHANLSAPQADLHKVQDILSSADTVFISGGDVEVGMQVLEEKHMSGFLTGLFSQGKLFFGLSAGSIMLAKEWVRWRDPDDDSTAELFPCMGFAPVLCDTHAEADDWEELKAALQLEKDNTTGYGIATGTGIKVYPDGQVEAVGGPVPCYLRQGGKVIKETDLVPLRG
jgi:dipeptidase E